MPVRVWVEAWQLQCCGTAFADGDTVDWLLSPRPDLDWLTAVVGPDVAETVTHSEDHHGGLPEGTPPTSGTVTRIQAVACRYAPMPGHDPDLNYPVPGSGRRSVVHHADGWDADVAGLRFAGYLVDLDVTGPQGGSGHSQRRTRRV